MLLRIHAMLLRKGIAMAAKRLGKGERRCGLARRQFSYAKHLPERRSGCERRSGNDRRKSQR